MIAERNQKNHRWTSAYPVINIVITELWTIIRLWQCSIKDFEHLLEDRTCFHGLQLWPFFNCTSDACPGMSTEKAPNCLQEILLDSDIKKKIKTKQTNQSQDHPCFGDTVQGPQRNLHRFCASQLPPGQHPGRHCSALMIFTGAVKTWNYS